MHRSDETRLTLYGWLWCPHCHEAALLLHRHGATYEPKLMEQWMREGKQHAGEVYRIAGRIAGPTIVFPDGSWLQEPTRLPFPMLTRSTADPDPATAEALPGRALCPP